MGSSVGRLYFYAVSFVGLLVAAYGGGSLLATLGKLVLEPGTALGGEVPFWRTALSTYIPLAAVAGAVWAGHWMAMGRRLDQQTSERQATLRKVFLNAVLVLSAGAVLFNATRFLYHLLSALTGEALPPLTGRGRPQDIYNAAIWLLLYGVLWYYHWRVEAEEGRATPSGVTLRRWYVYLLSLASLGLFLAGAYYNLSLLASRLIGVPSVRMLGDDLGRTVSIWSLTFAPIVAGMLWWVFHWRYAAGSDGSSVLRRVYLYLWILLGVAGTAVALGIAEYQGLRFLFGYRDVSPGAHLRFVTYTLPLLLVSVAAWAYHRNVAREEAVGDIDVVERRYNYLIGAVGLIALTAGLAMLVRTLLEVGFQVEQEIGRAPDWWRDQLSASVSITFTGVMVWLPRWNGAERTCRQVGSPELKALSRRLYLYGVLLSGVITALFNGAFFLNSLLRLVLGEPATARLLSGLFTSFGTVAIAGVLVLYHWRVLLRDRAATGSEPAAVTRPVTVLASGEYEGRARQLQAALGAAVPMLRQSGRGVVALRQGGDTLSQAELDSLMEQIRAAPGQKVLVVFTGAAAEVHSYD